jgi:hypothetical protein
MTRDQLNMWVGLLAIAAIVVIAFAIVGCSESYLRERNDAGMRNGVVTDLHKYCLEYPKDSACQGPASK